MLPYFVGGLAPCAAAIGLIHLFKIPFPHRVWLIVAGGAATSFVALLGERIAWNHLAPRVPAELATFIEMFFFVALIEEVAKLALVIGAIDSEKAQSVKPCIALGLLISSGFAGAENVLYCLSYSGKSGYLIFIRMLTAVPFHLSLSVISTYIIWIAITKNRAMTWLAMSVAISTGLHGLYDYLITADNGESWRFLFALALVTSIAFRLLKRPEPAN